MLANVAKYLARFGQKVFVIDFDLEAPGLHYKLNLSGSTKTQTIKQGLVDYIYLFVLEGEKVRALPDYVINVDMKEPVEGAIHLMPAGNVLTASYWSRLAQISWHDLFYKPGAKGVAFFLELKARIQRDFDPDFLLIDSRTGITEVAGVATTILPDYVICILLRNLENMEGAREVLRSIKRTRRIRNQKPIKIIPVLARLPVLEDSSREKKIISEIKRFLNQDASEIADTLSFRELQVLHSDRDIEVEESVLIEGNKSIDQSLLLRDYIRLFAQIFPKDVLAPHIESLIQVALSQAKTDPRGVEQDLLALTEYSMHPEPFQALLNFYREQKTNKRKILWTAYRYWKLLGSANAPTLIEAVTENFEWAEVRRSFQNEVSNTSFIPIDFVLEVWRAGGESKITLGLKLARALMELEQTDQAAEMIKRLIEMDNISQSAIIESIQILFIMDYYEMGIEIAERFKESFINNARFQASWAKLVLGYNDRKKASQILVMTGFQSELVKKTNIVVYINLLLLAGKTAEAKKELKSLLLGTDLRGIVQKREDGRWQINSISQIYKRCGLYEEFVMKLRSDLSPETAARILRRIESED